MVAAAEGTVEPVPGGFRQDIQRMAAYFYADNGIRVSTRATQLQQAFEVLTEMFDWVGLLTNLFNTVIMVCQPCCTIGGHSVEAYSLGMTIEGLNYM